MFFKKIRKTGLRNKQKSVNKNTYHHCTVNSFIIIRKKNYSKTAGRKKVLSMKNELRIRRM